MPSGDVTYVAGVLAIPGTPTGSHSSPLAVRSRLFSPPVLRQVRGEAFLLLRRLPISLQSTLGFPSSERWGKSGEPSERWTDVTDSGPGTSCRTPCRCVSTAGEY